MVGYYLDRLTRFMVSYYLISPRRSCFPSPRHNRQCELNDYGSDGSDNCDTHQHVYSTRKRCIRNRPRPRVHACPQSAKPSTTPIGEQHHPMEAMRRCSSTRGMRTIHVCFLHSPSSNHHANPLLIPTAFRSTMQIPPLGPPRSL